MATIGFQVLLNEVSRELTPDNLESLKFLCSEFISKRKREAITTGLLLFETLEEMDRLSPESTGQLCQLLRDVKRLDLQRKVAAFSAAQEGESLNVPVCETDSQTGRLDDAFDVVCNSIGRDWRVFARRLGITDPCIQQIECNHPHNMKEQVMQCLKKWHSWKGRDANVDSLVQALRLCKLNLIADKVEEQAQKSS